MRPILLALALLLVAAGGFGAGWILRGDEPARTDTVPRQLYQDMATQSNHNLDSFREALDRCAKLEAENAKLRDELSECREKHK